MLLLAAVEPRLRVGSGGGRVVLIQRLGELGDKGLLASGDRVDVSGTVGRRSVVGVRGGGKEGVLRLAAVGGGSEGGGSGIGDVDKRHRVRW